MRACALLLIVGLCLPCYNAAVTFPSLSLFFDQPSLSSLRASSKKVFAHYFAPYPISIDNKPEETDYYTRNYLNPEGESGKWRAAGGYLRDRPIPRPPYASGIDYKMKDIESEIRMAVALGIDGFTFDLLGGPTSQVGTVVLDRMLAAIPNVDPGFRVMLVPDMNGVYFNATNAPTNFPAVIKKYWGNPYMFKLADGRLVVSPFLAEKRSPSWYKSQFDSLAAQGYPCAFVPMFLNFGNNFNNYKDISYGASVWGSRSPRPVVNTAAVQPAQAHAAGKIYMQPVAPQDHRPKTPASAVRESENSLTYRVAWDCAINSSSEWTQIITWSDYSEHSHILPSKGIQYSFYDLTAYYTAWYKTGVKPQIKRDAIYYFHRNQPAVFDHTYAPQTTFQIVEGTMKNEVEMLVYLTAPADLKIQIGSSVYTKPNVAAGQFSFKVPVSPGTPVFSIIRGGVTVLSATSNTTIVAQSQIYTSDFMYRGGSVTGATPRPPTPAPTQRPSVPPTLPATAAPTLPATAAPTLPATSQPTPKPAGAADVAAYYKGCYNTGPTDQDLTGAKASFSAMKVNWCMRFCATKKYKFAAVQNTLCTCDDSYGSFGSGTGCVSACPGNSSQICGDKYGYRNSVYASQYQGCFIDDSAQRTMGPVVLSSPSMTNSLCRSTCNSRSLPYAGLQNANQCFCSAATYNSIGEAPRSECATACAANSSETCGQSLRNQVYTSIQV